MKQLAVTRYKWLRYLLPIPIGLTCYILILLAFDSLNQLSIHFFSQEVFFIVFLTYVLIESLRAFIHFIDKKLPLQSDLLISESRPTNEESHIFSSKALIISGQLLASLLFSMIIVSLLLSAYYLFILKISQFQTELVVFNVVFGVVSLLFTMIHTSTTLLTHHSNLIYNKEIELRKGLEHDLEKFKLQINPTLLFDSLENLISLVHTDKKAAENYIEHLSKIYRHSLDSRKNELIPLKEELDMTNSLLLLLNVKHTGCISYCSNLSDQTNRLQIVPGTVSLLLQHAVNGSIISSLQPLHVELADGKKNQAVFIFDNNQKLTKNDLFANSLDVINKAYRFYNNEFLKHKTTTENIRIEIPLFEIEEE